MEATMRKTILGLSGAAAALVVLAGGTTAAGAPAIPMSGAQEAAAADNNGHGSFTYDISGTGFCYTLIYQGIESPTAAHVHLGDRHVAGDVVIPLDPGDGSGTLTCTTITQEVADAITADPKAYYVNVHNETYPAGAIRGQLKG
jgi:hypothetical protein